MIQKLQKKYVFIRRRLWLLLYIFTMSMQTLVITPGPQLQPIDNLHAEGYATSLHIYHVDTNTCHNTRASITTHRQGWQRSDKVLSPVTSEWQSWVLSLLCQHLSRCRQRSESIIKVTKIFRACTVYTILPFVTYRVVILFSYVTLLCHPCRWVIIGALQG